MIKHRLLTRAAHTLIVVYVILSIYARVLVASSKLDQHPLMTFFPHDFPMTPNMNMKTSIYPGPTSTLSNQDSSSPPAVLTVVLSVACGAVATCILVTVRQPKKKKE